MTTTPDEWVTLSGAAKIADCDRVTVHRAAKREGGLAYATVPGSGLQIRWFRRSDVEEWARARQQRKEAKKS